MKKALFALLAIILLPSIATAQLFNGMPQPTELRFIHAYNFSDAGNSAGIVGMYRFDPTQNTTLTAGVSYNHTSQSFTYSSWQGIRLFDNSLHVLHMANYNPDTQKYSGHIASTLLLPGYAGNGTYQVNGHVFNYNISGAQRYLGTAGARVNQHFIFNAGATAQNGEADWVANARLMLYKMNWIEYRYNNLFRSHQLSLYLQF